MSEPRINVKNMGANAAINNAFKAQAAISKLTRQIKNLMTPDANAALTGKNLDPKKCGAFTDACAGLSTKFPDHIIARNPREAAILIYKAQKFLSKRFPGKKFKIGSVGIQDGYLRVNGSFNMAPPVIGHIPSTKQ
jgi:hypothetical protein